ncbi:hypothetical protein KC19_3G120100 [Ceratodon purpureus]|uniref:GOLD domain-containing protein n=1 Tax=Ceratodon purpureus TaxID=3225 RepID=A0A8T0IJW1_CERPU|nr:hypothetical protein KC19_3G120100 [Ceratodon purpureus]KAG0583239.1 hypothetical protein KC19_3G120100 [Ceratodon purpureus]
MSREVEMAAAAKRSNSREYWRWIVTVLAVVSLGGTQGIKFNVHEHECWVHETEVENELVQMFVEVLIDVNPGPFRHMGVDVVIQAPGGQYIHTEKVKQEAIPDVKTYDADANTKMAKYEATINFTAVEKGRYNICFHNRGNVVETVRLEMLHELGSDHDEPVKDVHIRSLMDQMASLSDALVDVEFEQDRLASHRDRHASILSDLSKRVVYKAVLEAFAFIACSVIQVVLLQRLLHKHLAGKQL